MKAYVFQAALICEDCARAYMASNAKPDHVDMDDESSYDSDHWPKGPYSDGGGEADCPQHCDHCGEFLENSLTMDGDCYVRTAAAAYETEEGRANGSESWQDVANRAEADGRAVLAGWIMFYLAWG